MIIWFDGTPRPSPDYGLTSDCIEAIVETIAEKPQDGTVPVAQLLSAWQLLLSLPDTHYLATDGYYIQNRNHQEESKA